MDRVEDERQVDQRVGCAAGDDLAAGRAVAYVETLVLDLGEKKRGGLTSATTMRSTSSLLASNSTSLLPM